MKFALIYILPILVFSACHHSDRTEAPTNDAELQQKLIGRWRSDERVHDDIHVQEETIVDSSGGYVFYGTNTLDNGEVRAATLAGTLQVKDGLLIDTITNDIGGNTLVPRILSVGRIIRLDKNELIVRITNGNETIAVTNRKDSR